MAKRRMQPDLDFASELARRNAESLRAPRFAIKTLVKSLGVERTLLAHWLKDARFAGLDANRHRIGTAHRLLSARDVMILSASADLAGLGVPTEVAINGAETACEHVIASMATLRNAAGAQLVIFRDDTGDWQMTRRPRIPEQVAKAAGLPDLPPVCILFDLERFTERVLSALGLFFAMGGANAMRRAADQLKRRGAAKKN